MWLCYRRPRRTVAFLAGDFLAAVLRAGAFVAFLAVDFVAFLAVDLVAFLAAVRLVAAFLAGAFFAAALRAGALLAAFLAADLVAFLAGDFFAALRAPLAVTPRFTAGPSAGRRCAPETTALN